MQAYGNESDTCDVRNFAFISYIGWVILSTHLIDCKQIIIDLGKRESYFNRTIIDLELAKTSIFDKEKTKWKENVKEKPKLDFFSCIKPNFCVEPYIKLNISRYERSLLSQLRYGILQIQLETGRYKQEDRNNRLCKICNGGEVEDQCHFVFKCPAYMIRRSIFNDNAKIKIPHWDNLDDISKFKLLFEEHPRMLAKYVKDIFLYRKSLIYR